MCECHGNLVLALEHVTLGGEKSQTRLAVNVSPRIPLLSYCCMPSVTVRRTINDVDRQRRGEAQQAC